MNLEIMLPSSVLNIILVTLGGVVMEIFSTVRPLLEQLGGKKYQSMLKCY